MTAVSYGGTHKMTATNHTQPKLKTPGDAILRVTTRGIWGSDLHMYDGRTPSEKGDWVVLPFSIACGYWL